MTRKPLDTLDLCEKLKKKGFTQKQAIEVIGIFKDRDDGYHENFIQKDEIGTVLLAYIWQKTKAVLVVLALIGTIVGSAIGIKKAIEPTATTKESASLPQLAPSAGTPAQNIPKR